MLLYLQIAPSRNTPTCVGKTHPHFIVSTSNEKHPHVRGEDTNIL